MKKLFLLLLLLLLPVALIADDDPEPAPPYTGPIVHQPPAPPPICPDGCPQPNLWRI